MEHDIERKIEAILETLRKAKDRPNRCTLLIGAGYSVKAGIPLASGFIDIIKNEYSYAYELAKEKSYAKCMDELASRRCKAMALNAKNGWKRVYSQAQFLNEVIWKATRISILFAISLGFRNCFSNCDLSKRQSRPKMEMREQT